MVSRVLHKVRNLSKSVIKWNVHFSNVLARWAAQNAAVAAVWAAERAEDEAEWAAHEARIREKVSEGLVRRVRGKRGVGNGRRRNRRAGKERQQQRQEQTRRARTAEIWRKAEAKFVQQQESKWLSKGGMGSTERQIRQKQRRVREWARRTKIWRQRPKGQAGEHEGSAPARCWRQVRAAGAGWGHRPCYRRLGGGGKRGWVT